MDERRNPFAPGAGSDPPELAGRTEIRARVEVALERVALRRAAQPLILFGLRGVGKTVLLNRLRQEADGRGHASLRLEVPKGRELRQFLVPTLGRTLRELSSVRKWQDRLADSWNALASLARAANITLPEAGDATAPATGDLSLDLRILLSELGRAAGKDDKAFILFIDEMQDLRQADFAALIECLHEFGQTREPVTLVGAGLPQVRGWSVKVKTYAERLFHFEPVGALEPEAAAAALREPARREGVAFTDEALAELYRLTEGYPYFIQVFGSHVWLVAERSPITIEDVRAATDRAIAELDASFFSAREASLTRTEQSYLRAMAELGPGPHRSGEIAARLGRDVTSLGPVRQRLIDKGLLYSPGHGETAFSVPLFHRYLLRSYV